MNSQVVSISKALKSYQTFYAVASFIAISIFLSAGFVSVSVIWFFAVCLYNVASRLEINWSRVRPLCWPISFFGLSLIWMIFSPDRAATTDLILRMSHMLLIPLGFLVVDKTVSDRAFHFILTLFLGGCVVCSLVCLGNSFIHVIGSDRLLEAAGFHFTYAALTDVVGLPPAYFGIFCSFAVLTALESPFLVKKAKLAVVLYLGGFILLISSVASSIAMLVVLILWFCYRQRDAVYSVTFGLLLIALASSVVYELYSHSPTVDSREMQGDMVNSIAARLTIWSFAAEAAENAPITGYGPALGQAELDRRYDEGGFSWGVRESLNPHNQFLSTYLDLGIMGVTILIALLIHSFVLGFKSDDLFLLGFTILVTVFFCFESVLVRQKGIVFFSFFYSFLITHIKTRGDRSIVI